MLKYNIYNIFYHEIQIELVSVYWVHLSRFHLKIETESSFQNVLFQIKYRTMDNNVQNWDSYINIPSSQTYR
jgi:hypothetical protein